MEDSEVRWQDEILEVMYWMRGEHLGHEVSRSELARFLSLEPAQLGRALDRLVTAKLVEVNPACGAETFALSERGVEEGRRRFEEEFSAYLGRANHLTCDDPSCDCNSTEWTGPCPSLGRNS